MVLSTEGAARMVRRVTRRRVDGSRRLRTRRGCAEGDPAAQEAVRAVAAHLSGAEARELSAAAPKEPADAAARPALIGQAPGAGRWIRRGRCRPWPLGRRPRTCGSG
ncbi:hypothetical protein [Streptomyces blattellae]|uniref:hypothetical protein n=1 Tax=Streptomyces blattellae TaxID=2569855 RepID=UPI0012B9F5C3|nr:hypothetical protein [Streptomyces blattellae]